MLTWGLLIGLGTGSMALVFAATIANRWFVTPPRPGDGRPDRRRRHRSAGLPAGHGRAGRAAGLADGLAGCHLRRAGRGAVRGACAPRLSRGPGRYRVRCSAGPAATSGRSTRPGAASRAADVLWPRRHVPRRSGRWPVASRSAAPPPTA